MDAQIKANRNYLSSMAEFTPTHVVNRIQEELDNYARKIREELEGCKRTFLAHAKNEQESRFHRLPAELSTRIIGFAIDDHSQQISGRYFPAKHKLPALMHVSSKLRNQTAEIFCGNIRIEVDGRGHNKSWFVKDDLISRIDPAHKKYIRTISTSLSGKAGFELPLAQARAAQLDQITGVREGTWFVGYNSNTWRHKIQVANMKGEILGFRGLRDIKSGKGSE